MVQTITAMYARHDENWTVSVSGLGRTLGGEAPGIIAARDRADQLVEELAPESDQPTVVHLINGSAVEFTSTYIQARLSRIEEDLSSIPDEDVEDAVQDAAATTEHAADEVETGADADLTSTEAGGEIAEAHSAGEITEAETTGAEVAGAEYEAEAADAGVLDDTADDAAIEAGEDTTGQEDGSDAHDGAPAPMNVSMRAVPRRELDRTPETAAVASTRVGYAHVAS